MTQNDARRFLGAKRCIDGYTDALNHREWDRLECHFLPDATWRTANFREFGFAGGPSIACGLRAIVDPMAMLVQMVTATVIDFSGDARALARSTVQELGKGVDESFLCLGSYVDELYLVDGVWRFGSRVFTYFYWEHGALNGLPIGSF